MTVLEQRLSMITLGVRDLIEARAFYTGVLGWKADDDNPHIAFFDLGGYILALYPHQGLADDMQLPAETSEPARYPGFSLAYCTRSRDEVDVIFAKLRDAGVAVLKDPQDACWGGYSGYFRDPDGYAWEVAFNPFKHIAPDGRLSSAG
jgi:uncharacterized protein